MSKSPSLPDNFEFNLIGTEDKPFIGYISSKDKTNITPQVLVRGSKNVYKKLSGTWASRFGLKRRGTADSTVAGVKSSYTWYTSLAKTLPLRVANAKLQVESDLVTDGTYVWYDLMTSLTKTRMVFDTWWDNTAKKDKLLFCDGTDTLRHWSGGISTIGTTTSSTIPKLDTSTTWGEDGFENNSLATIGDSTTQFDITNTAGNTYRYTFDGTGTDPAISATTVPAGTYVLIGAQNFATANNGLFTVTASGANYFEVTNAAGTAESNKTIGTGYIYVKFANVLKIGTNTYAYTGGVTTTTLTGVTPNPSAETSASVAIQAVISEINTPADGFLIDFIRVIGNRVHCGSYTSRLIYISDDASFTDYTVPTPRTPGSPELLILDNNAKGIGVRQGKAHIFAGQSDLYIINYQGITVSATLTEQTTVDKQKTAYLEAAYAHEFIDNVGDDLVWLSQDQQLRTFGTFRNMFQPRYPSLSQAVATELSEEDFTGGHLRAIGDFIYITAPNNGRDWMHQTRYSVDAVGNITAERLWHPPQVRNVSRFEVIDSVVYGHSNANPQLYQIWDTAQWHDDGPADEDLPYDCVAKFAYRNDGRRQGLLTFDKAFFEGYISNGTELLVNVYFDYQGSTSIQNRTVNSIEEPARFIYGLSAPSLGGSTPGDNPLGDGLTPESNDQELLPKFKTILNLNPVDCFEYSLEIYSQALNSRWEILCCGVNSMKSDAQAVFIRK